MRLGYGGDGADQVPGKGQGQDDLCHDVIWEMCITRYLKPMKFWYAVVRICMWSLPLLCPNMVHAKQLPMWYYEKNNGQLVVFTPAIDC